MRVPAWGTRVAALVCVAAFCVACSDVVEVVTGADPALPPFCDDVEPIQGTVQGRQGVEDDDLVVVVDGYASLQPTYGGAWYDRARGTFVVAFTDDPEPHRDAIEERLGDHDGAFDVVQVERSMSDLRDVADQMSEWLRETGPGPDMNTFGGGASPHLNRVSFDMILADDDARRELAEVFPVDAICVRGPAEPPVPVDRDSVVLIGDDEADPLVQCRSLPFRLSALDQPLEFEDADHPVADALRTMLAPDTQPYLLNATGWRLLADDGTRALLAAGAPITEMVELELLGDVWVFAGSWGGPCEPRLLVREGLAETDWWLDPRHPPPGPGDRELHVEVIDMACGGASEFEERLIGPQIRESDTEVQIAFSAIPLRPGPPRGCIGHESLPVTVTLDRPLGDRVLVDAFDAPPRQPITERTW